MATKNLVPRQDNEGKLGLPTRRWAGINAVLGSLDQMKTDELLNKQGAPLIAAGDNITIIKNPDESPLGPQYIISSSDSGSSEVDRIFEGEEGVQTSVEVIKTSDPVDNKISFSISGDEKWFINSDGHFVPRTNSLDLGLSSFPVRDLYLQNDGLNLGSSNLRIDNASKNLQIGTLVNESLVYEDVTTSLEDVKFATTGPIDLTTELVNGLEIDGQLLTTGDRVLVKDQATSSENGIYIVSAAEGPAVRANDLIATSDFSGIRVAVLKGDSNTQKIFFTVPHTDGSSKTATSNMKWVKLGSGGLEAVEDDPAPVLGGDLNVNGNSIQGTTITLKALNNDPNSTAGLTLNSQLGNTNLTINSHTDGPSSLNFTTPSNSKFLKIESVTDTFFTNNNIPSTFTYKFNDPTQDEINARTAYFATQSWVSGQGFLTSTSLDSYVTDDEITDFITAADLPNLTNYIQTNDNAALTSLTLSEQPQNDADAANKQYVDLVVQGLREVLQPVRLATTVNINLTDQLENNDEIDGVNVSTGDRILVREQDDSRDNGIYIVQASGAAVRSSDFELNDEVSAKFVFVEEGDTYAQSGFICTSPETDDTVGTHDILFAKFSAAGQTEAGAALSKTGNVFDVKTDGTSIEVDSATNSLKIKNVDSTLLTGTINVDRIPNIPVSKISGDIVASSVDENAINPDDIDTVLNSIADDDLFIIRDVSANSPDGLTTKSTASVLKNYIRTDITDSIGQVGFNVVDDNGVQKLSSSLTSKAISEQTLYNSGAPDDGPLSDDDTFLVYDDSSTSLKKVAFSDIKAGSDLNIASYDDLAASDVTDEDQLLIRNSEDSLHKSVKVSALKEVFSGGLDYVPVTNTGNVPSIKSNTHYHITTSPTTNGIYTFVLNGVEGNEGDIIKITMSPSGFNTHFDNALNDRYHYDRNNIVKIQFTADASDVITFNKDNFDKPVELVLNSLGLWKTSILPSNEFSYTSIADVNDLQLNNATSGQTNWAKYPAYYILDEREVLSISLPSAAQVKSWGYKQGHKKTFYFKSPVNQKINFISSAADILISGSSNIQTAQQTAFKLSSSSNIKKITLTLLRQTNSDSLYWFFEHYIDEVGDVELPGAISAQSGDENKVLKFVVNSNEETVLSKGLVQSANIDENAIAAGETSADRIVQNNAIKKTKLEKVNANKVLGHLGSRTGTQDVGEVNILADDNALNNEIDSLNKHTNLVTATAIKQYVNNTISSIQTEPSIINTTVVQDEIYTAMTALPYQENIISSNVISRVCPINNADSTVKISYLYINFFDTDWENYIREVATQVTTLPELSYANFLDGYFGRRTIYDKITKFVLPRTDDIIDILKERQNQGIKTQINVYFDLNYADISNESRYVPSDLPDIPEYGHGTGTRSALPFINFKLSSLDVTSVDAFKYYGESSQSQIDEEALDDQGALIQSKISDKYRASLIAPDRNSSTYGPLSNTDDATFLSRVKCSLYNELVPEAILTKNVNGGDLFTFGNSNQFTRIVAKSNESTSNDIPFVQFSKEITRLEGSDNSEVKTFYAQTPETGFNNRTNDSRSGCRMSATSRGSSNYCYGMYTHYVIGSAKRYATDPSATMVQIYPKVITTSEGDYVVYKINTNRVTDVDVPHTSRNNPKRMPEVSFP